MTQFGPVRGNPRTVAGTIGEREFGMTNDGIQLGLLGCLFHLEGKACLKQSQRKEKQPLDRKKKHQRPVLEPLDPAVPEAGPTLGFCCYKSQSLFFLN